MTVLTERSIGGRGVGELVLRVVRHRLRLLTIRLVGNVRVRGLVVGRHGEGTERSGSVRVER